MFVEVVEWIRHGGLPICSIDFQPNGKRVATGGNDKTVRIWNSALLGPDAPPTAPSPAHATVAPTLSLASSGQEQDYGLLAVLTNHTAPVNIGRLMKRGDS